MYEERSADLETVDSESTTRFGGTILQVRDNRVMNVFFLLPYVRIEGQRVLHKRTRGEWED